MQFHATFLFKVFYGDTDIDIFSTDFNHQFFFYGFGIIATFNLVTWIDVKYSPLLLFRCDYLFGVCLIFGKQFDFDITIIYIQLSTHDSFFIKNQIGTPYE